LPEKIEDAFVGMTAKHTRGHAVRCIMETVAEALARQVACLCGGEKPELVRAAGGAARSDLWLQIKADRLGVAVAATQCPEPTSLGAACLAVAGLKWMPLSEVVGKWVALRPAHRPTNKKSG
jgi:sugar (pentulose or hexulose) kinase